MAWFFSQALEALRIFVSCPGFAGLVVTEFNAGRDPDGAHAEQLATAVTEALNEGSPRWAKGHIA